MAKRVRTATGELDIQQLQSAPRVWPRLFSQDRLSPKIFAAHVQRARFNLVAGQIVTAVLGIPAHVLGIPAHVLGIPLHLQREIVAANPPSTAKKPNPVILPENPPTQICGLATLSRFLLLLCVAILLRYACMGKSTASGGAWPPPAL